jgi:hypothetical protein
MWVVVAAVLVLFMQAGFAMLEVGFSRMKNVGSVVAKILAMMGIGLIAFWVAGFALTFSDGGGLQSLIGTQGFFLSGDEATYAGLGWTAVPVSAKFLFQVAFALVSLAIVWGTMLERTKFAVYCIFAHGRPPLGRDGCARRHAPLGAQDRQVRRRGQPADHPRSQHAARRLGRYYPVGWLVGL